MDLVRRCNNLHHSFVTEDRMAFWSKWFSSTPDDSAKAVKSLDYKGFLIEAQPYKEGGQFQLAGTISKEIGGVRKEHRFVRADKFQDKNEAADIAISKGQLIVDQMGEGMFRS
jgi:hypothetical protein